MSGTVTELPFEERRLLEAAERQVRALNAAGIDGLFPFGELMQLAQNPRFQISEHEKVYLINQGLLHPDGSLCPYVRKAVLSTIKGW